MNWRPCSDEGDSITYRAIYFLQFIHRGHFIPVQHSQLGEYDFSDSGFKLKTRPQVAPAPLFGEHNKYVLTEVLGMSEATFEEYTKAGVLQ